MKQITWQSLLIRLAIAFVVIFSTLLYLIVLIIPDTSVFLVEILVPIIAIILGTSIVTKDKEIISDNKKTGILLIIYIVLGFILNYIMLEIDAIMIIVCFVGILIGYFISKRGVCNKITNNTSSNVINEETNNETYRMTELNDDNVVNMLTSKNINPENYLFAVALPQTSTYLLVGNLASVMMTNYYVSFDNEKIYLFEISMINNKVIKNVLTIQMDDIEKVKITDALFGVVKRIKFTFKNKKVLELQCNKKIGWLKNQTENLEKFVSVLESKQ